MKNIYLDKIENNLLNTAENRELSFYKELQPTKIASSTFIIADGERVTTNGVIFDISEVCTLASLIINQN